MQAIRLRTALNSLIKLRMLLATRNYAYEQCEHCKKHALATFCSYFVSYPLRRYHTSIVYVFYVGYTCITPYESVFRLYATFVDNQYCKCISIQVPNELNQKTHQSFNTTKKHLIRHIRCFTLFIITSFTMRSIRHRRTRTTCGKLSHHASHHVRHHMQLLLATRPTAHAHTSCSTLRSLLKTNAPRNNIANNEIPNIAHQHHSQNLRKNTTCLGK